MADQNEIDDLFNQFAPAAEAAAKAKEEAGSAPAATRDSGKNFFANIPEGKPGQYGPFGSRPDPKFGSVHDALSDHMKQMNKMMAINDTLMYEYIFNDKINISYYELWRSESNQYYRKLCTLKRRLAKIK